MEEKKKKRNWKRIAIYTGVGLVVVGGSILAYKKCPKFEKGVNNLAKKVVGVFKKSKTSKDLPEINVKPFRKYEKFNKR